MTPEHLVCMTVCIGIVAFLYSAVGHAGASGYIAVMTLFSMAPDAIKPTALVLNIMVACIGSWQFWRAGHFSWRLFWPFAVLSIPFAFLGGYLNLPAHLFKMLVGVVLILSALKFVIDPKEKSYIRPPSKPVSCGVGAGLGLLAGCTGTGGGIFLTPLVLLMGWASTKTASAVSALFILANSISGLAGNLNATKYFPAFAWSFVATALVCGTAGSYFGSRKFSPVLIKRLLAVVLTVAGFKLLFAR
ncbi:MAG: sulfite exporter TauE/SafE family protein [bacterium]